jgi:hypothetical protein
MRFPKLGAVAGLLVLTALAGACGGGGGGGDGGLGSGPAVLIVQNNTLFGTPGVSTGSCTDGATANVFLIVAVTVTNTGTLASETYTFAPGLAVGSVTTIDSLPIGTYSIEVTYDNTLHESDQCPADSVSLVAGDNVVEFEY